MDNKVKITKFITVFKNGANEIDAVVIGRCYGSMNVGTRKVNEYKNITRSSNVRLVNLACKPQTVVTRQYYPGGCVIDINAFKWD